MQKFLIKATSSLFLLVVALLAYFMGTSPIAFQKLTTIKFVDNSQLALSDPSSYIDIQEILQQIPYGSSDTIYTISPKQKYQETILQGYGNCSNLTYGLAYYFESKNHEYQIIHFLLPNGFLRGWGHAVINTPFIYNGSNHYGIVDILEGGLPQVNGQFIDVNLLRQAAFTNTAILPLNERKDNQSPYYENYLNNSVIGIIKSEEIKRYFSLIATIYIPLGNEKLEKILYDGLAVVFGFYPNTYVAIDDKQVLMSDNMVNWFFANTLLISMRLLIVTFAILIFIVLISRKTKANIS